MCRKMPRDTHIADYPLPNAADYKYQTVLVISDGTFHQSNGSTWTQIFPPGGEANTIAFTVYLSKTKTNIGTAYVDIYNSLEPDELFNVINFDNFTDFRILFIWDYIGAGM